VGRRKSHAVLGPEGQEGQFWLVNEEKVGSKGEGKRELPVKLKRRDWVGPGRGDVLGKGRDEGDMVRKGEKTSYAPSG